MNIEVGNKIRKIRLKKGYSQEYMAFNLHISQKTYSRIENNQSKCDIDRLVKIADLLEVDIGYIINGKEMNQVDALNDEIRTLKKFIGFLLDRNDK
jgi:transcriptional regulator with XRE-family HTH domain